MVTRMHCSRLSEAALALVVLLAAVPLRAEDAAEAADARSASESPVVVEPAGEPVPTRWRHFGRVLQVDRAERIVVILSDPVPGRVPAECFSRNEEMKPTSRLTLLPARRSGVFAALARGGLPSVGEEVVFDVTP
jgi:hypothetical protein